MKNNIKEIIKRKGLKTSDVISNSGIVKSYFYDVMNGNSVPTLTVANQIALALDEDIKELFPELKRSE